MIKFLVTYSIFKLFSSIHVESLSTQFPAPLYNYFVFYLHYLYKEHL